MNVTSHDPLGSVDLSMDSQIETFVWHGSLNVYDAVFFLDWLIVTGVVACHCGGPLTNFDCDGQLAVICDDCSQTGKSVDGIPFFVPDFQTVTYDHVQNAVHRSQPCATLAADTFCLEIVTDAAHLVVVGDGHVQLSDCHAILEAILKTSFDDFLVLISFSQTCHHYQRHVHCLIHLQTRVRQTSCPLNDDLLYWPDLACV